MESKCAKWIIKKLSCWMLSNKPPVHAFLSDFSHVCSEIRPGDVLLVEGRSYISRIIQRITLSPWSHAALYIGQIHDIKDTKSRETVKKKSDYNITALLLIESEIGVGTIVSPLTKYKDDHVRILRPHGLSKSNVQKVINYASSRLGGEYNLRHLLDLARFLFPWGLFPRRWRSSLFEHNALQPTRDICSSMIADAFQSIKYPILPLIRENQDKNLELIRRNSKLFCPSDFDYSPYFDVIKYPVFKLGKNVSPDVLPWRQGAMSNDLQTQFDEDAKGRGE